jgi:hypothetical protein
LFAYDPFAHSFEGTALGAEAEKLEAGLFQNMKPEDREGDGLWSDETLGSVFKLSLPSKSIDGAKIYCAALRLKSVSAEDSQSRLAPPLFQRIAETVRRRI